MKTCVTVRAYTRHKSPFIGAKSYGARLQITEEMRNFSLKAILLMFKGFSDTKPCFNSTYLSVLLDTKP
jgi:hypothetical protein